MINEGKECCKENFSDAYEEARRGIKKVRLICFMIFAVSLVLFIVYAVKSKTDDYGGYVFLYNKYIFFCFCLGFFYLRVYELSLQKVFVRR